MAGTSKAKNLGTLPDFTQFVAPKCEDECRLAVDSCFPLSVLQAEAKRLIMHVSSPGRIDVSSRRSGTCIISMYLVRGVPDYACHVS